jgi:acyl transferase domain-containing protein/thioesterase domain-containing protein/acyl carrier protein
MSDEGTGENDIAIVGMSLRIPGASSPDEYWQNLREGKESIVDYDEETMLASGESKEAFRNPAYVRRGGALRDMKLFDRKFFGFGPKEAAILDPQHRQFMELCWEALEDGGHTPKRFDGQIGLFAGCGMGSYFYFNVCSNQDLVDSVGLFLLRHTGNDKDFLSTRVSYVLDLRGPSINVQTACSTSLVATHLACQSLLTGESDLALAGGVTILFPTEAGYVYREGEVLSPDGHCHAFDHRAQGTILSSGGGVVALRRLEDALEDGDEIYAVIKGSAVNNDGGRKVGYLAPSVEGQAAAMTEAYSLADIDPTSIGLIECHGTGTYMGDPIEIAALTQAFRASESEAAAENQFCRIGSVKTNIGHLDTAAGVVGLMKAALALKNAEMPPSLNYDRPNPEIGFENTPFIVNDTLQPWISGSGPRRAAVNSLGVGGTNAHVVLEEAIGNPSSIPSQRPFTLLQVSAKAKKSLDGACERLAVHLEENVEVDLADVAFSLQTSREELDFRRIVVAKSRNQAIELLRGADPRRIFSHSVSDARPTIVFMFSGGGSQYPNMGRGLYQSEPVFREHIDRGLDLFQSKTGADLRRLVFCDESEIEKLEPELTETSCALPAIFIFEYAMVKLLASKGIEPQLLIGHSLGENGAACVAGVLSFEACLDWVILRGRLTESTPRGGMLAVSLPAEDLETYLADNCDLAASNSPGLSVASGAVADIETLEKRLEEAEIDCQRVQVDRAGHSRLFEPILDEFRRFIEGLDLQPPKVPIISNRTGQLLTNEQATDPNYWVDHLRNSVQFSTGLSTVLETPGRVLVEVGPGQALCSFARQQPAQGALANIIPACRHRADSSSDAAYFLATLGRLWASGVELDLSTLYEGETRRRIRLPTYAWDHQSYFIDRVEATATQADSTLPEYLEDITDWGFVPDWQPAAIDPRRLDSPETWLIFMDRAGIGGRLRKKLESQGHTVFAVYQSDSFRKRAGREYSLSPELGREGYDALIKDLAAAGHMPSRIAHLWLTTDRERFRPGSSFFHENLQNGFYSLYFLARAMADENLPGDVHLTVVSTGLQQVIAGDGPLYPEKATALGPIEVIPRELPGVTCKSIDVTLPESGGSALRQRILGRKSKAPGRPESLDEIADLLETELLSPAESDIVAYRGDDRFIRRFEPSPLRARDAVAETPLVQGGVYLITGGLGGLGLTLADRLAREVANIRLVLVGRTPLSDRDRWDELLASPATSDKEIQRIRRVRSLEAAGAEVMPLTADVTNLDEMRRGVGKVRERFGALDGIFHVAGVVSDELMQLKGDTDIERVFGPKVHGTLVLDSLLEESGASLLVLYSSTSAITAPPGQVDYVAANSFLDAFAQSRRGHAVRTVAINWGIWNEVGLAAETLVGEQAGARDGETVAVSHPFFDSRGRDSHGRTGFLKQFSPQRDWILEEHRTSRGEALFPGAGYPELARAALVEYGETGPFRMEDLFFLRPLYVPDGEVRDVRVQLKTTDQGYHFGVRTRDRVDGREAWVLTAEATLELGRDAVSATIDLAAIDERCQASRSSLNPLGHASGQEKHVRFGPRWRVLRQVLYGEGEALAHLEVPDAFVTELADYRLHPALLDYATGYAMELIEGYDPEEALWVPVSYGRITVHGPLEKNISSWVKIRQHAQEAADFASFDVVIANAQGQVLFEAEDFSIKRVMGTVDVAAPVDSNTSDIEFEASTGVSGDEDLSPAELGLRRNYEAGIRPEDGTEALLRVLADDLGPQVAVTSINLDFLLRQAERVVADSSSSGARFERPDLDSEYKEPRDEVEKTLVTLWEELLGVEGLGIGDSFFDLGGHSLIAVRLFSKIKKTYRVDFPISVLFEAPTIEGCAGLIRDTIGRSVGDRAGGTASGQAETAPRRPRFKHLVAMDAGGDAGRGRSPFFLVAGMFGNVLNLRHLASLVGADRSFYGLQARGLYGDESPHATFEEMASAYLEEIRSVQPKGPYLIGGFSGGGITAYEMAHQLKEAGEEVAMLLMLDSILPTEEPLTKMDRVRVQWLRVRELGPGYVWEWARKRAKWQMEQIEARLGRATEPEAAEDEFHNVEIERAFRAALPRYSMRRYAGHVHLFRPKLDQAYVLGPNRVLNTEKRWVQPDNAWGSWVGSMDVVEVPGDHDSMVLEPNVRVMAARLRELLDACEGGESPPLELDAGAGVSR